jgi:hypothetical protein
MNREQRRKLRSLPRKIESVGLDDLLRRVVGTSPRRGGVALAEREGVWIHSFMCNRCGLHFKVHSWLPDRHRTETVWCPECGQHDGQFRHYRVRTSEIAGRLDLGHPGEIFNHCEHPGSRLMDDSTVDGLLRRGPLLS